MTVDASLSPLQLKSPVKTAYTKAVATGKASRQLFNDSDDEEHRPIQQGESSTDRFSMSRSAGSYD